MDVVGGGEYFGLVDVVDTDGLEDLRLDEVADARLGHDGDSNRVADLLDEVDAAHARHTARGADIARDALERHDGDGPRLFGDLGVLGGDDVHDHAALEHLRQTGLHRPGRSALTLELAVVG